jgi:hypothetical protein
MTICMFVSIAFFSGSPDDILQLGNLRNLRNLSTNLSNGLQTVDL